ncbi:DUF6252 family protein [Flavobacterium sp.]|uniref:DUF6252 family protein n=1 Tax=Flavobacterium sp. TaxID=239 RepID=UPI00260CC3E3|nr:DUF6252 family protein [Flavobacterium sp.]
MRKLLLLSVSILMVTLTACSSNDSNDNTTPTYIKFKVDDVTYAYQAETNTSLKKIITGRVGEGSTYREISLSMPVNPKVGSHKIVVDPSSANDAYTASFAPNSDTNSDGAIGKIIITSIDFKFIRGTFYFYADYGPTGAFINDGEFVADK